MFALKTSMFPASRRSAGVHDSAPGGGHSGVLPGPAALYLRQPHGGTAVRISAHKMSCHKSGLYGRTTIELLYAAML